MNLRWERYRAGTAMFDRMLVWPGGRRVAVFDRAILARKVARSMASRGLCEREIATGLRRSRAFVRRACADFLI